MISPAYVVHIGVMLAPRLVEFWGVEGRSATSCSLGPRSRLEFWAAWPCCWTTSLGPLVFNVSIGGGDSRIAAGWSGWGPKHKMEMGGNLPVLYTWGGWTCITSQRFSRFFYRVQQWPEAHFWSEPRDTIWGAPETFGSMFGKNMIFCSFNMTMEFERLNPKFGPWPWHQVVFAPSQLHHGCTKLRPGIANFSGVYQESGWLPPTLTVLLCVVSSIASGAPCRRTIVAIAHVEFSWRDEES